jgi:hypothetical protein
MTEQPHDPVAIDHAARNAELEQRIAQLETDGRRRLVHAELKSEALRAGMIDLDGLKLVDLTQVELDPNGEVKGAAILMRDLRRSKPWLFGGDNSSAPATPPSAQPSRARTAAEMTETEWRVARAELLRTR